MPTAIDLNAISTNDAATQVANTAVAANATATSDVLASLNAPTSLPPTWTDSPQATNPPAQASPIPPTSVVATGVIYYIFNGDSIAMLNADGSHEELLLTGGAPANLTLSPDEQWLAFTRQVSDGVREVFVMSLKTEGVPPDQQYQAQQVSCLGFARILYPIWASDNRQLAFAASQVVDGTLGIYTTDISGQCPMGNHQRGLVQTQFKDISGMTWNVNRTQIYFASVNIYAVDAATGVLYPPLSHPTGYGPDFYPLYRPDSTTLYYFKTGHDDQTSLKGGVLAQVDTTQFINFPLDEIRGTTLFASQMQFNHDGSFLVASGTQDVFVQNMEVGSAAMIVQNAKFPPQAVFSSDSETIAYVDSGAGANLIQQIWLINRRGTDRRQLTAHIEGTVTDMNWTAQ